LGIDSFGFGVFSLVSFESSMHTSQGDEEGAAAPRQLNFSGRSQQPKMYLLNEKMELILLSEIKCPKSGIFTRPNNYWLG